jgi:KaiC/GvpD/RAD55 family RecA-like ATPase
MIKVSNEQFEIEDVSFTPYMLDSIINLFIWDNDFLKKCYYLINPKFLEGERKVLANICYDHFRDYKEPPGEYILDSVNSYVSTKPNQKKLLLKYLDKVIDLQVNRNYVINTFGKFVKQNICKSAIEDAKVMIDKGKIESANEHIVKCFREASLITGRKFIDILKEDASTFIDELQEPNIKTFIEPYDDIIGGWFRDEMIVIFGEYNVGKTYFLIHIAKAAVLQGKNVLHITLETSDRQIKERYAATFTATKILRKEGDEDERPFSVEKLRKKLSFLQKRGKLWLMNPVHFSLQDFVGLVNEIEVTEGVPIDLIIVDSPDQMSWGNKYRNPLDNEKELWKGFLDFVKERQITVIVTTQAQRPKSDSKITKGYNVGGTIAKSQIPDIGITLSQNERENREEKMIFFQFRHRGGKKFIMIEIQQDIEHGQAVLSAKLVKKESRAMDEMRALGLQWEKQNRKQKDGEVSQNS